MRRRSTAGRGLSRRCRERPTPCSLARARRCNRILRKKRRGPTQRATRRTSAWRRARGPMRRWSSQLRDSTVELQVVGDRQSRSARTSATQRRARHATRRSERKTPRPHSTPSSLCRPLPAFRSQRTGSRCLCGTAVRTVAGGLSAAPLPSVVNVKLFSASVRTYPTGS